MFQSGSSSQPGGIDRFVGLLGDFEVDFVLEPDDCDGEDCNLDDEAGDVDTDVADDDCDEEYDDCDDANPDDPLPTSACRSLASTSSLLGGA